MWQSQTPPGAMQRAQEWGLIAMRPLVVGERIYVRLLYSPSPLLVCLDKSSGKLIWVAESRENEFLVSDPVVVDGRLVALGVQIQPDQQGVLRHHQFDLRTGEIERTRELVRLRSTWGLRACCEIAEFEDGFVVVLGGAVLAVDGSANVRWIRTQATASPDDDRRWVEQLFQRPIVNEGRLYVAQPGVRSVDCLSAATGRSYWSATLPELVGVIGLAGDLVVVQTAEGVCGIDTRAGTTRWQVAVDNLFSFHLVDDSSLLLASRERSATNSDRWLPRLTWVNLADGKMAATTVLSDLADSDPRLGPLLWYQNRLFAFFGRGQQDATRDLVELIPKGQPERAE
jgi:outer membrane protein assembly factor BamB